MNPEIQKVLQQIEKYKHLDIQRELSFLTAKLQVLLAEESEKSAQKITKLTRVLTVLTIVIAIFTAALVFMEFQGCIEKNNKTVNNATEQNQTNKQMRDIVNLKNNKPVSNTSKGVIEREETKRK